MLLLSYLIRIYQIFILIIVLQHNQFKFCKYYKEVPTLIYIVTYTSRYNLKIKHIVIEFQ